MRIKLKSVITFLFTLGMLAGIIVCIYISATKTLTSNESLLLSILLTLISIIASYIISSADSENRISQVSEEIQKNYNDSLKTYANKAAEKVLNLSNELEKLKASLSITLEEYEEDELLDSKDKLVLFIREKIASTIHILEALKSTNDTFLSDWKGVIGDQIQLQQNLESQIKLLSNELEDLRQKRDYYEDELVSSEDMQELQSQINKLENTLAEKLISLPYNLPPLPAKKRRIEASFECPCCGGKISTRIRTKNGAKKILECANCHHFLLCEYKGDNDISIYEAPMEPFTITCPICKELIPDIIPSQPGTIKEVLCNNCSFSFQVAKSKEGVNLIQQNRFKNVPDVLIERVFERIPPDPWDQGMHKRIAEELGISPSLCGKIISKLIREGRITHISSEEKT